MKIYLAGAINKCDDGEARGWRERAKELLLGHEILDPMARDYRGIELESVNEIVKGDLDDIDDADVMLVRCERPSWGTAMEVALSHGKLPIVGFGAGGKPSPWLIFHTDKLFPSIEVACAYLCRKKTLTL